MCPVLPFLKQSRSQKKSANRISHSERPSRCLNSEYSHETCSIISAVGNVVRLQVVDSSEISSHRPILQALHADNDVVEGERKAKVK